MTRKEYKHVVNLHIGTNALERTFGAIKKTGGYVLGS